MRSGHGPGFDRDPTEARLRELGLPLVLSRSARLHGLVPRSCPVLAFALVVVLAAAGADRMLPAHVLDDPFTGLDDAPAGPDHTAAGIDTDAAVALAVLVLTPLCALALAALVWWLLHRTSRLARSVTSVVVVVAWLLLPGVPGGAVTAGLPVRVILLGIVLVAGYLGAGAILGWALRRSRRELSTVGPMIVRVLPILMLTMLFVFFNAAIWQVAVGIDNVRAVSIVAVLLTLAWCVVVVAATDAMRSGVSAAEQLLHIESGDERRGRVDPGHDPLGPGERLNFLLLRVASQGIQVVIFSGLMAVFFLAFGQLSVPAAVEQAWTGRPPTAGPLGVSQALLRVAIVLGAFGGLSFAASSGADRTYRATFLAPILDETRRGLEVRAAYRARRRRPDTDARRA